MTTETKAEKRLRVAKARWELRDAIERVGRGEGR
jgi:hypothetical protein